jgi:TPR repeat protein
MGLFDAIKAVMSRPDVTDEAYYEVIARELAEGTVRSGLWVKALAEASYDEPRAKARYIELRLEALKIEVRQDVRAEQLVRKANDQLRVNEQQILEADALPAYQRADYEKAFRGFAALAEKGQPQAQNYLGFMYEYGQCVAQDINAAVEYYKMAADQNDKDAQFNLGRLCLHRLSSYDSAEAWFALA